ncbi:MAG: M20/M25/M40 family metallo-hydrolase [Nanoarchaeota archaeon]|nr:M20/M25/M40 family metallo-hydrolase [Nanoarchaeota archaeon]MBU1270050.1 M20/M25/M40 family metallo-hydrolase [Nanoarchaeota archaeon]MBU1604250.1 M20/M25/M40 family metallo-hydrolase [Nanoarchaeota archaeon]MBU2443786.1 M20/M25/M40 family metallo-hydrolase [Nanoarchaeota archaeon]
MKKEELVKTTKELIAIESCTSDKDKIVQALEYVKTFFSKTNFIIKEFEFKGVKSLLVTLKSENPALLLHGHIDVVPAPKELFKPIVKDGKIFGRGAIDMKSGLAVLMHVIRDLSTENKKVDVGLLITTDEEIGGYNSTGELSEILKPKFVLSAEPTNLLIGNNAKGVLQLELSVTGKSAHAAYPWEGENAILKMVDMIAKIKELFPKKGDYYTTINFSKINAGDVLNKVPDQCTACVDIRFVPEEDPKKIIKNIESLGLLVKVITTSNSSTCDKNNAFVKKLQKSLKKNKLKTDFIKKHGASDIRHFTKKGVPGVTFGPTGKGMHAPDESVEIESLDNLYKVIKDFCLTT